jgi:hypothetical protein
LFRDLARGLAAHNFGSLYSPEIAWLKLARIQMSLDTTGNVARLSNICLPGGRLELVDPLFHRLWSKTA